MSKQDWLGHDFATWWVMAWGFGIFALLALAVVYGLVAFLWDQMT